MKSSESRHDEAAPARAFRRDVLELWINLARRNWGSLVVLPADRDGSTAEIATALADTGRRLSFGPVTAITVSSLEFGSALALADLQQHVERLRQKATSAATAPRPDGTTTGRAPPAGDGAPAPAPAAPPGNETPPAEVGESLIVVPPARVIVSIPPVLAEPLGLAAIETADAVVLAIRMCHSRVADVKRTIQLVGRERIAGCLLLH